MAEREDSIGMWTCGECGGEVYTLNATTNQCASCSRKSPSKRVKPVDTLLTLATCVNGGNDECCDDPGSEECQDRAEAGSKILVKLHKLLTSGAKYGYKTNLIRDLGLDPKAYPA